MEQALRSLLKKKGEYQSELSICVYFLRTYIREKTNEKTAQAIV